MNRDSLVDEVGIIEDELGASTKEVAKAIYQSIEADYPKVKKENGRSDEQIRQEVEAQLVRRNLLELIIEDFMEVAPTQDFAEVMATGFLLKVEAQLDQIIARKFL